MALLPGDLKLWSPWNALLVLLGTVSVFLMVKMYRRRTALNSLVCSLCIGTYHRLTITAETAL